MEEVCEVRKGEEKEACVRASRGGWLKLSFFLLFLLRIMIYLHIQPISIVLS